MNINYDKCEGNKLYLSYWIGSLIVLSAVLFH